MDQDNLHEEAGESSAASSFDFSEGSTNCSQGTEKEIRQDDSNDGHVGYDSDDSAASSIVFSDSAEHRDGANRAANEVHRDGDADSAASSFDFGSDGIAVQDDQHGDYQDNDYPHETGDHYDEDDGNRADSEDGEQYEDGPFYPKPQSIHNVVSLRQSSSPGASSAASSIAFDDDQQPQGDFGSTQGSVGPARRGKYHEEAAAPAPFVKPRAPPTSTYLPSSITEAIRRNGPSASVYRSALHYFEAAAQTAETQSMYNGESFARKLKSRYEARVKAEERQAKSIQHSRNNKRKRTRTPSAAKVHARTADEADESWLTGDVREVALRHREDGYDRSTIRWDRCLADTQGTQSILQEAIRWKGIGGRGAFSGT